MAEIYSEPVKQRAAERIRSLVLGLSVTALAMFVVGVVLAVFVDGPAKPWTGLAYVMSMALALVVGLSKTSSA